MKKTELKKIDCFLVKIEAGCYLAYCSCTSDPFAKIVKICSHRWRVYNLYRGYHYDFRTLDQCKVVLGID